MPTADTAVEPGSMPLEYPPWEAFCQSVACGELAAVAYRKCIPGEREAATSWQNASKLLANVRPRVNYLRKIAAGKVGEKFGVDAETLVATHLAIIGTPLSEIDEHHHLCQKLKRRRRVVGTGEEAEPWEVEEIEAPSKSKALDAIALIIGANAATKTENQTTNRTETSTADLVTNLPALHALGAVVSQFPEAAAVLRDGLEGRPFGAPKETQA